MDDDTPKVGQTASTANYNWVAVLVVLVVGWLILRAWSQSVVDGYNKCYMQATASNDRATQATIAAGYSEADATSASFDNFADQTAYCSKQLPPGWIMFITGAHGRDN